MERDCPWGNESIGEKWHMGVGEGTGGQKTLGL